MEPSRTFLSLCLPSAFLHHPHLLRLLLDSSRSQKRQRTYPSHLFCAAYLVNCFGPAALPPTQVRSLPAPQVLSLDIPEKKGPPRLTLWPSARIFPIAVNSGNPLFVSPRNRARRRAASSPPAKPPPTVFAFPFRPPGGSRSVGSLARQSPDRSVGPRKSGWIQSPKTSPGAPDPCHDLHSSFGCITPDLVNLTSTSRSEASLDPITTSATCNLRTYVLPALLHSPPSDQPSRED